MAEKFESLSTRRRHGRTVTISTVASCVAICAVILPLFGYVTSPLLVGWMSNAMAGEIRTQVQAQVSPVNAALKVLIRNNIAQLEDEVSALEFKRTSDPTTWSALDAHLLTTKKRRLDAQREALQAMIAAESAQAKMVPK